MTELSLYPRILFVTLLRTHFSSFSVNKLLSIALFHLASTPSNCTVWNVVICILYQILYIPKCHHHHVEGLEKFHFFFMTQQPLAGQGLLIVEPSLSHSDTPQSVGLLWTGDQPDAETSTWQKHTTLKRQRHPCPRRDSNPQFQQASGRRPTP
jgi:hypothetical protein